MRSQEKQAVVSLVLCTMLAVALTACVTAGRKFPTENVAKIQIGTSTMDDIKQLFGPPWRTGLEDGEKTWTYGTYHRKLFKESEASDLVIRFNNDGVVRSYSFSTTPPEDMRH